MSLHITKTYNAGGEIFLRHSLVRQAGEAFDCKEISFFKFPDSYDTDADLDVRMDGIISAFSPEDFVIFQYPSTISARYDRVFLNRCKAYRMHLAILVEEVPSLIGREGYSLEDELDLLKEADLLIFPSEEIYSYYKKHGLQAKKILAPSMMDCPCSIAMRPEHSRKLAFFDTGNAAIENACQQENIDFTKAAFDGYYLHEQLLKLSHGGFGLVADFGDRPWDAFRRQQICGIYLSLGLPVVVDESFPLSEEIVKNGLGFVAKSLKDAIDQVANMDEEKLSAYYNAASKYRPLYAGGFYGKELIARVCIELLADEKSDEM